MSSAQIDPVFRDAQVGPLTVGEPVRVYSVRNSNLTEINEWTAPVQAGKKYLGTISAWIDPEDDAVDFAYLDDSEVVAEVLPTVAQDPQLSLLVDPLGGGRAIWDAGAESVQPVEGPHANGEALTTANYLSNLEGHMKHSLLLGDDDLVGGASGFDTPAASTTAYAWLWWFGVPAVLVLLGAAGVVYLKQKRTDPPI